MFLTNVRHARVFGAVLGAVFAAVLVSAPAFSQVGGGPPGIDQYLVYRAGFVGLDAPVILRDQFIPIPSTHIIEGLGFFANPVEKDATSIVNPFLHYTWWHFTPQPFSAHVIASNKYGDQELTIGQAEWLLNPALKFPQPGQPIPVANHYKCYRAQGFIQPRPVLLHDQFGTWNAQLTGQVEYFCNPADKTYQGVTDPMIRPDAHLVCYRIDVTQPGVFPISFVDQFLLGGGQTTLQPPVLLCVPTLKQEVVPADVATWGKVKAMYR